MANKPASPADPSSDETRPPLFGTWRRAYLIVLLTLAVELVLFAWLSQVYR